MRNTIEQQMMLTAATTSAKSNSQLAGKPHSAIVTLVGSRRKSDEPQRGAMRSTPALEQPVQDTQTSSGHPHIPEHGSNPRHPRTPAAIRDNHTFSNPGHPHIPAAIRDNHTFERKQSGTPVHSGANSPEHPLIQTYPGQPHIQQSEAKRGNTGHPHIRRLPVRDTHLFKSIQDTYAFSSLQQSEAIRNTQTSRFIQDKHILQCSPGHP